MLDGVQWDQLTWVQQHTVQFFKIKSHTERPDELGSSRNLLGRAGVMKRCWAGEKGGHLEERKLTGCGESSSENLQLAFISWPQPNQLTTAGSAELTSCLLILIFAHSVLSVNQQLETVFKLSPAQKIQVLLTSYLFIICICGYNKRWIHNLVRNCRPHVWLNELMINDVKTLTISLTSTRSWIKVQDEKKN